jgi:hypothetical protein
MTEEGKDGPDWWHELPAWVREDRPLDEAGWTAEFRMTFVLDYLDQQTAFDRRMRLFASACCRRVWDLLRVDAAKRIVELSEAYADGGVAEADLQAANNAPEFGDLDAVREEGSPGAEVQLSACVVHALTSARGLASPSEGVDSYLIVQNTSLNRAKDFNRSSWDYHIARSPGRDEAEFAAKEQLLRDIFGNPFRPVAFDPAWRMDTAVSLARGTYDSRDFAAMPILADALQDAGCDDADILAHCRDPHQVHVRGCWVVDLVLGKE